MIRHTLFILLTVGITLVSCKKAEEPAKELEPFDRISSNGNVTIKLVQGTENRVISATIDEATYKVNNGTLSINASSGSITIAVFDLESISMNSGSLENEGEIHVEHFDISMHAGSAELQNFHVAGKFDGSFTNTGTYTFKGTAGYSELSMINSVQFKGVDFITDSTKVNSQAVMDQEIHATQVFRTSILSTGDVYYRGTPTVVDTSYFSTGRAIAF